MIEREIDYLQFSLPLSEQHCIDNGYELMRGAIQFYKRGYKDANGLRYYFGNPNSIKALVIASGETLQFMRDMGHTSQSLAALAIDNGGIVTRMDLAVTEWVDDNLLTMQEIEAWVKWGLIESPLIAYGAKKLEEIGENGAIETIYIGDMGKRGKRGIFRGYDKGIELDLGDYLATRIELEERGENSHNSAKRIANGVGVGAVFRSRFNVLAANFERVIEQDAVSINRGGATKDRTKEDELNARWSWLMKQVAPALKAAREDDIKLGLKQNRFYWFMREAGLSHDAIVTMLSIVRS